MKPTIPNSRNLVYKPRKQFDTTESSGFGCNITLASIRRLIRFGPNIENLSRKRRRHRMRQWRAEMRKPYKWSSTSIFQDAGFDIVKTEYEDHDGKRGYCAELVHGIALSEQSALARLLQIPVDAPAV